MNSASRTWSDEQLTRAVKVSTSWRGVMRELGLAGTSAGAIRTVRRKKYIVGSAGGLLGDAAGAMRAAGVVRESA